MDWCEYVYYPVICCTKINLVDTLISHVLNTVAQLVEHKTWDQRFVGLSLTDGESL